MREDKLHRVAIYCTFEVSIDEDYWKLRNIHISEKLLTDSGMGSVILLGPGSIICGWNRLFLLWQQEITENAVQRARKEMHRDRRAPPINPTLSSTAHSYRFSTSPRKERALPCCREMDRGYAAKSCRRPIKVGRIVEWARKRNKSMPRDNQLRPITIESLTLRARI